MSSKNWELVEFKCMIQDILGNEIYKKTDSDELGDRTIFYCITVPGENDWVSSKGGFMTRLPSEASTSENRLSISLVNWSYPIPSDGKNRSCLIKVYDMKLVEFLRVNDIVQVSGLIEPPDQDDAENIEPRVIDTNLDSEFEPARDFPTTLVPRVHVETLKKLEHINPLLPDVLVRDKIDTNTVKMAHARLSTILTQLLAGDSLAADYLILSLISRIHRRKDVTTLGQLTIGLSGFKPSMRFLIDKLYEIIAKITTHSHFIDLSLANLNNLCFTPSKDHTNNKMIAGTLQLPDGLYLMLNETALNTGQLTPQGTENVNALNQIIRWQRHNYNFKYHSVEIDTDLKVLVVSEGKSILPVPYEVKLEKNDKDTIESMKQACEAVDTFLTEDLLNMFRYFITALKDVPEYSIPDDVQKSIQKDFVQWRQEGAGTPLFSATDLSSYMTVARYVTISRGETVLTNELWKITCQLEKARRARLSTKA